MRKPNIVAINELADQFVYSKGLERVREKLSNFTKEEVVLLYIELTEFRGFTKQLVLDRLFIHA